MPVGARRESGAVLITALLILVILTVLGISATGDSTLEERMAGNYRDQMSAREAAEMGIRSAEDWLRSNIYNAAQLDYTASPSSLALFASSKTTGASFAPSISTTNCDETTISPSVTSKSNASATTSPSSIASSVTT